MADGGFNWRHRAAVLAGLSLLALLLWRPFVMAVVYDNLGSLFLNRALLAPDLQPEERVDRALRAARLFQTALAWNPLDGQAYYNLASAHELWKDPSSAARALARAAALSPGDACAQFKHGRALAERGREEQAIQKWRAAGAATYFVNRGLALAGGGDLQAALEQYERAVAIDPTSAEAHLRLGQTLSRLGRGEEALDALESAAARESASSPRRHLLQAEVHVARGEWTAALAAFGQAAALSPRDPEPHYRRGSLLAERLDDDEAAIASFERALGDDPDHVPSRLALGRLHERRGRCGSAARWLAPLLSPEADGQAAGRANALVGECLLEQGQGAEAIPYLERALALDPDSVERLLPLAQAYGQAGRPRDAAQVYLRVLDLAPHNEEAQQALERLGWSDAGDGGNQTIGDR